MFLDSNNVLTDFNDTVYSAVMIPDVQDYNGDTFSKEEIRKMMETFMMKFRNFDTDHNLWNRNNDIHIVENFQTPVPIVIGEKVLPVGTWVMGLKITSQDIIDRIRRGELRGLSATALQKSSNPIVAFLSNKSRIIQTQTFRELGDFDIIGVSLVEDPSYEDALFIAYKEKEDPADSHEKKEKSTLSINDEVIASSKAEENLKSEVNEMDEKQLDGEIVNVDSKEQDPTAEENIEQEKEETASEEVETETKQEDPETEEETETATEEVETEEEVPAVEEEETPEVEDTPTPETETKEETTPAVEDLSVSTKEKAELENKIKELEEQIFALKNRSTQPDTVVNSVKVVNTFDVFGNLIK